LGTSVHVDWTNLPLRPIFLPLVSRLTFYLAGAEATQPHLAAGTPLVVPLAGGGKPTIEITRPTGETIRLDVDDTQRTAFRYADTYDTGVYEVQLSDVARRQKMAFALNLDPAETAPAIMSHDALRQRFGEAPLVFCEVPTDLASTIRALREGESLLELFLIAVLIALVGEAFVANRRVDKEQPEPVPQPRRITGRGRYPQRLDDFLVPPQR
jgi:hypothetical protein